MTLKDGKNNEAFEALSLPRKEVPDLLRSRYRVYKDAKDYVLVEAASALDALKASGLPQPSRIERDAIYFHNVMKKEEMGKPEAEAVAAEQPSAIPVQEVAEPAAQEPAAAQPLSGSDVDKLLQG